MKILSRLTAAFKHFSPHLPPYGIRTWACACLWLWVGTCPTKADGTVPPAWGVPAPTAGEHATSAPSMQAGGTQGLPQDTTGIIALHRRLCATRPDCDAALYQRYAHALDSLHIDQAGTAVWLAAVRAADSFTTIQDGSAQVVVGDIGHMIMHRVSYHAQQALDARILSPDDASGMALRDLLARHRYMLDFPTSNWEKAKHHLAQGNWAYLWSRFKTDYLTSVLAYVLLPISLLLNLWLFRKYKITKTQLKKS